MDNSSLYFIDLNRNDKFSAFDDLEIQELINQIQNYNLEYHNTLNLPRKITFAPEIEFEDLDFYKVRDFIEKNCKNYTMDRDGTVLSGGEIHPPILRDTKETWKNLKKICQFLKENNALMDKNAGGHIHIGAHILKTKKELQNFIKLYIIYEHVLYRFGYGNKLNIRQNYFKHAAPIADSLVNRLDELASSKSNKELLSIVYSFSRRYGINLGNIRHQIIKRIAKYNTIEYRFPNATSEEVILQNNINALTKFTLAAHSSNLDSEFLDYKLKHERISSSKEFHLYNEVCLKSALELVDIIFTNNLDKIYFLRQYIKDFETTTSKEPVYAKRFVA